VIKEVALTLDDLGLPPNTAYLDQKFHDHDEPYLAWTHLVERIARLQTPLLRHIYGHWNLPHQRGGLSDEEHRLIVTSRIDLASGVSVPQHPLVISLAANLFRCSGEAIEVIRGKAKCCDIGDDADYCNIILLEPGSSAPYPIVPAAEQIAETKAYYQSLEHDELVRLAKTLRPRYDQDAQILYFGDRPVRQVGSASSQEALFLAFEDASWSEMIESPFTRSIAGHNAARDATSLCRLHLIKDGWPIFLNLRAVDKQQHVRWEIKCVETDGLAGAKNRRKNSGKT
jgi:hypothetical protein